MIFGDAPFKDLQCPVMLIQQMIGFVEDLPDEWHDAWTVLQYEAGREAPTVAANYPRPKSRLQEMFDHQITDERLRGLAGLIRGLMRFLPDRRLSADTALKHLGKIIEGEPVEWPDE